MGQTVPRIGFSAAGLAARCLPVVFLTAKAANKLQASPHIFRYGKRFMKPLRFSLHVPTGGMV